MVMHFTRLPDSNDRVESAPKRRRRTQLAFTPNTPVETVEAMMVRLHNQFPKDMERLAK